jgi:hypothetical protein
MLKPVSMVRGAIKVAPGNSTFGTCFAGVTYWLLTWLVLYQFLACWLTNASFYLFVVTDRMRAENSLLAFEQNVRLPFI